MMQKALRSCLSVGLERGPLRLVPSVFAVLLPLAVMSGSSDATLMSAAKAPLGFLEATEPGPRVDLPVGIAAFNPTLHTVDASAPVIAEISRIADRGEVVSMTGVDLDKATGFHIFSQPHNRAEGEWISVAPLSADATAATLLLPETLAPSTIYLISPMRDQAHGPVVAINRTDAWWLGPEKAVAGSVISIYGRNLVLGGEKARPFIYLKPIGAEGRYIEPISAHPFRVEFAVPDLPAAAYEIWVHNGHGGRYGWSGPLALDVSAQSPWRLQEEVVFDVRDFGAVGNGVTDDTAALERSISAASASAPATIRFPAGTYLITQALHSPSDVTWLGDGMDKSEIRLARATGESMIISGGANVRFSQLTLSSEGNTGQEPLLRLYSATNASLLSVRIDAWGTAALDAQNVSGLSVRDSELIENGSFYGASRQVFFTNNRFRMTGNGESVAALWGGSDFSMIGNEMSNADESRDDGNGIGRFFVGQAHAGNMRNLYWERNVSRNAAPFDCDKVDCNKGEQICFEIVGSRLKNDFVGATVDTVTFSSDQDWDQPLASGRDLVVVGGRGAGQRRTIVSIDGATAKLDVEWVVVPDATSRFAYAATASRAVIYKNTFEGRPTYDQHDSDSTAVLLYGNVYDVVVDSNEISHMRHGMMTVALDSAYGLSPYFLQYSNNRVSRSNSGLYVGTTFADEGVAGIWGGLGNVYRKNIFEDISYIGVEYETWDHPGADYNGTVFDRNRFEDLRYGFIDGYKLMWTHDGRFKVGPEGRRSRRVNTVLYRNEFFRGSAPSDGSAGFLSLHRDNSWINVGSTWQGFARGNRGPAEIGDEP